VSGGDHEGGELSRRDVRILGETRAPRPATSGTPRPAGGKRPESEWHGWPEAACVEHRPRTSHRMADQSPHPDHTNKCSIQQRGPTGRRPPLLAAETPAVGCRPATPVPSLDGPGVAAGLPGAMGAARWAASTAGERTRIAGRRSGVPASVLFVTRDFRSSRASDRWVDGLCLLVAWGFTSTIGRCRVILLRVICDACGDSYSSSW
jgi:hypothetical protein